MSELLNIGVSGIQCDAPGCGYNDPSVVRLDYDKYLNAPCPKCGAPLLTEADMLALKALEAEVALVNHVAGDLPDGERLKMHLAMRGDGTIDLKGIDQ